MTELDFGPQKPETAGNNNGDANSKKFGKQSHRLVQTCIQCLCNVLLNPNPPHDTCRYDVEKFANKEYYFDKDAANRWGDAKQTKAALKLAKDWLWVDFRKPINSLALYMWQNFREKYYCKEKKKDFQCAT